MRSEWRKSEILNWDNLDDRDFDASESDPAAILPPELLGGKPVSNRTSLDRTDEEVDVATVVPKRTTRACSCRVSDEARWSE